MSLLLLTALTVMQAVPFVREHVATAEIEPGVRIEINNVNGDVVVRGWDKDYVEIKSTMTTDRDSSEFDRVEVSVRREDRLVIETKYLDDDVDVSVDYEIKVPARAKNLEVSVVNGDVVLDDVKAEADLSVVNGQTEIRGGGGPVTVESVNGGIVASESAKIRKVSSVSGDIEVRLNALNPEGVELGTVSGEIRIRVDPKLNADVELGSISGRISIRELDLKDRDAEWNGIQGRLNRGGPLISANSVSGSVILAAEQ